MSTSWSRYSASEVTEMTAVPMSPVKATLGRCAKCGDTSVKFYYHELAGVSRTVGASYFWCDACRKFEVFSVAPMSGRYRFDDPFLELDMEHFAELEASTEWFPRLQALWDSGSLPQTFIPVDPPRG